MALAKGVGVLAILGAHPPTARDTVKRTVSGRAVRHLAVDERT